MKKKLKEINSAGKVDGSDVTWVANTDKEYYEWRNKMMERVFEKSLEDWEFLDEIMDHIDIESDRKNLQLAGRKSQHSEYEDKDMMKIDTRKRLDRPILIKINKGEYLNESIKLKDLLLEKYIGDYNTRYGDFQVFENPKSIQRMDYESRAISFPNGNLIVVDDGENITHQMLGSWLNANEYNVPLPIWNPRNISKGYIPWQRWGKTNDFYLGESLKKDYIKTNIKTLEGFVKKIKTKNSKYNFILKRMIDK